MYQCILITMIRNIYLNSKQLYSIFACERHLFSLLLKSIHGNPSRQDTLNIRYEKIELLFFYNALINHSEL